MPRDPCVIRSNMVGHKIQEQSYAAFRKLIACNSETFGPSQRLINYIAFNAVWRSDVVLCSKIGESPTEILQQILILVSDCDSGGTSLPYAHKPDRVKTELGDGVPFGCGHRTQVNACPGFSPSSASQTQVLISYRLGFFGQIDITISASPKYRLSCRPFKSSLIFHGKCACFTG